MDTDRVVEFVSTVVIAGMIGLLAAPQVGATALEDRLFVAVSVAVMVGVPFAAIVVYVLNVNSSHVGPWGPEDVVFLAAVAPPAAATVWIVEELGLSGILYIGAITAGVVLSMGIAVVVRDATVGQWPPGSKAREERRGQNPPGE